MTLNSNGSILQRKGAFSNLQTKSKSETTSDFIFYLVEKNIDF
jgi:hypothetical protein